MTTTTYPSQGSLGAMGPGVDALRKTSAAVPAKAGTSPAKDRKSVWKRMWASFIASREQSAMLAMARYDRRLADELRVARDRSEWDRLEAVKAEVYSRL